MFLNMLINLFRIPPLDEKDLSICIIGDIKTCKNGGFVVVYGLNEFIYSVF